MAKTFQFERFAPRNPGCIACEEMFSSALDRLLSPADHTFFQLHLAACAGCMESYVLAQRGAAWLDLLKTQSPEPSADLMHRILAQTTGVESSQSEPVFAVPGLPPTMHANVIPFLPRPVTRFTRLVMEPRLALTAAMAFFSIALTMNLVGVRFDQMKSADLKPSNLKRTYYETTASATRYYDNLRVVRVLESRVDNFRQANSDDSPSHASPASAPEPRKPNTQPEPQQDKKPDLPAGSSRRQPPLPRHVLLKTGFHTTADKPRGDSASSTSFKEEGGLV